MIARSLVPLRICPMTHPSAASTEASPPSLGAPGIATGTPEPAAPPNGLPVQIVERFVASLSGPDGVSPATAAALGELLASQASPSRDVILRVVQEAVRTGGSSTGSAASASPTAESDP